ncbi:aspartate--ammonia ligase [Danxiaibacter flavus]|uniref:Aspartate--ammonia ligase n=1 Tax=Danxiaibacter flavus TaxID=3049108 RepID=A0ABV3ZNG8_9BACT|nr:aspartate--ammonia ligase [Chitinophagaceae bacterium DXS]
MFTKGLYLPDNYHSALNLIETEIAIKFVKDHFEHELAKELYLTRVSAPLFVLESSGYNDDLNGVERPASFPVKDLNDTKALVVHSLAKWKRAALKDYGFAPNTGLYTDMNAIRGDEEMDNTHSIYVDQWDWEKIIRPEERNIAKLKNIVERIYKVLRNMEKEVLERFPVLGDAILPENITFIHAEELLQRYPNDTPKMRENKIAEEYGAVFIIGIGNKLSNDEAHDSRAPDYDDWTTVADNNLPGLNGDIILYYPVLKCALEVSSMGIRVNEDALERQLTITNTTDRKRFTWHQRLLGGELPQTIGGGIGQSRICMFFLRKAHVGEVQSSIWSEEMRGACKAAGVQLL